MPPAAKTSLLLTGPPGIGKTTAVRRVAAELRDPAGFTTDEMRDESGRRVGFLAATFSGWSRPIAHVHFRGRHKVGRYGVDVDALDELAGTGFASSGRVTLIDEIGKMECLSPRLVAVLRRVLDAGLPVVASVALKGGGLIAEVKRRPDSELWVVSHANRDRLPERVLAWLGRGPGPRAPNGFRTVDSRG